MTKDEFDKDATTKDGIWRECAERLKIAQEAESENRIRGINSKHFRWGEQWDADIKNVRKIDGRPALTVNHTNVFCSRLENTLRQQRPRIKCHPVGDGANVETAQVVNGLIRHIEDRSVASVAYDGGARSSIDIGWGYWRIVSEYVASNSFDQELLIKPIRNPFTVYMDPSAVMPDGRDQGWCIISETMKRAEYKRLYPNAKNVEWTGNDAPGDMSLFWENKEEVRLAEYYRIHHVKDRLLRLNDGSVVYESEWKQQDPAITAAVRLSPIQARQANRTVVQWFRLNGCEVVDSRDEPIGVEHIPVVRCEGNVDDINGLVRRKGMVEDLKDPAQMFNYWRSAQTERYALAPKAPWVAYENVIEGHPEWNDANQKSYSVLVAKAASGPNGELLPLPQRTQPAQIEAGMSEAAAGAEHDLMTVAGMPQENPEISARVVGGNKYLQRRQGMQDLTHFQYYDNQTLAIAWTGALLLERIPFYYDTPRMQRILGEDGRPEMVGINQKEDQNGVERVKNDLTVGRYAVVMDTGPGYATRREESAERLMELLSTALGEKVAETSGDIILRNMDFYGADEVADRIAVTTPEGLKKMVDGLPKQAQNIVVALQGQLQQKDQIIQQQALEIKYKATIEEAKITAGREKVEKDNRTKLTIEEMKGTTSRDVAEIHGATQLLNTQTESAHEERAADKLIKAGTEDR